MAVAAVRACVSEEDYQNTSTVRLYAMHVGARAAIFWGETTGETTLTPSFFLLGVAPTAKTRQISEHVV